jgi:uncharacterized lipoprotein YmbA
MKRIVLSIVLAACGGKLPETRYYQLAAPASAAPAGDAVVVLEPLETDTAYDDERIVYRTSPYRLDYYQYQRWASPPGSMVSDYLAAALARTGRFRALPRELTTDAPVVLGGRVLAIEEVDQRRDHWVGRIALELTLTDARTGAALWTKRFDETEPLAAQTPEGLAAALSTAMERVVSSAAPAIEQLALEAKTSPAPMANRIERR